MDVGMDVEQLPQALQQLVAQLREVPPTIQEVDLGGPADHGGDYYQVDLGGPDQGGDYFRMHPPAAAADAAALWCRARLWVLGLIGSCSSLRVVKLENCGICSESEVERLCQGLKSNQVLRLLRLDGNVGFGSDFGCGQVSHILASSSTSLESLGMCGVGLEAAGLCQVLSTLLANTASRLQQLFVEQNPECLADERAPQLLAQLVSHPRTSKFLRELAIRETGLAVPGAALLSAALKAHDHEENTALQKLLVGGLEPILNIMVSSLGRCSQLVLTCSKEEEAGPFVETLAQMLRTSTNLRKLWLEQAHFSTQAWRCIFQALGANSWLSYLCLYGSTTLDHSVMDDLHQLLAGNPGLTIDQINNAPLKGTRTTSESTGFFYCTCSSCYDSVLTQLAMGEGGQRNVEHLPKDLRPLIAALTAVPPSIEEVDLNGPDHGAVGDMFRLDPVGDTSNMLWELRLLVLGLIGTCPSLRVVKLNRCNISREWEVERLCQGLKSSTVLRHLVVDRNLGFGTDFGCQQVSHILSSSSSASTSLRILEMGVVGMKSTGLSQLLQTLLANKQSQLQVLDLQCNPECLANDDDEGSAELLAQLLLLPYASSDQPGPAGTACRLRELGINLTGLSVGGATRLSAALAQNRSLRRLVIGPEPILKTFLMSSSSIDKLVLVCSEEFEEAGLADALAQTLRTNTTLRDLWLYLGHFSADEWRCIFEALGANETLSLLSLDQCRTLDHNVIDDLRQLCSVNPRLDIPEIVGSPLKGSRQLPGSKGLFTCSCTSCTSTNAAGDIGHPKRLIDKLSVPAAPSMTRITRQDWIMAELPLVPRSQRSVELSAKRRRVLSLVGSCASLKSIQLPYHDMIEEEDCEDVEALCAGMPSNPVLEELILDGNRGFGTDLGCTQLARVVSGCIPTLQRISLRHVGMKSSGLGHLVRALLATRGSTSVPMELDISHNSELGDAGAHLVEQLLICTGPTTSASSLTRLDICGIGMGESGARSLSLALKHNTSLRTFVVGEKRLDGPTTLLLQGLIGNQTLTHLHLWKGGNKPDMGLADILARVLQSSGTTARCHLSIDSVPFQPEEWRTIFGALERNQVLKVLEVQHCFDLEPVFNHLMQLLQVNTTIEEINLEQTDLRDKQASVEEQLRRNKSKEFRHDLAALPKANAKSCRVVLCGKEYAGKSTLWEAMKHLHDQRTSTTAAAGHGHETAQSHYDKKHSSSSSSRHKELEKRSSGISIHMLKDEADMRIAVWDFAGHRAFHALHDFMFPSANNAATLFVLAVSPILSPLEDVPAGGNELKTPERLEDEMLYWLRFIASNSKPGASKPSVVVVITHSDILSANLDPMGEVSWLSDAEKSVVGLEGLFHDSLTLRPEPFIVNAVDMKDAGLKKWANDVEKTLKSKLEGLEEEPEICSQVVKRLADSNSPIISTIEFANLCKSICEEGNMPYQEEGWKPVAAYLHDVGEVIYHPKLGFIVKNPRWFGHGVLGHMLDLFPLHSKRATRYNTTTNHRPRSGFLSKKHLSNLLEKAMQSVPGMDSKNVGVQPDDLIQLMLLLDLCYEQTPGDPNTGYLLPALFDDVDDKAANGKRPRTWRKWEAQNLIFVGRRLECVDLRRTILTDGFFPRLQVVLLRQALEKWVTPKDTSSWGLEKNLYTIRVNGMEIMLEYSGIPSYYVDILVKSSQPHSETVQFLHDNFISAIRSFCASQEGCPGVILREAIIRPACLTAASPDPVLCAYRKDQAIAIEELEQRKGRYPNYSHFWSEVVDGDGSEVLPAASDSAMFLLTGEGTSDSLQLGDDCYPLKEGEKRGVAVLISMEKYEFGDRPGGSVDRGSLKTLAGSLGLDINVLVDIKARELKEELVRIAQEGGVLPNDDCFVCFVNAHGNTRKDGAHYILDQEGAIILLDDIMRPFTTCEHLREKPKVFFVNSCQGNNILVDIPGSPFAGQPADQPWNEGNETRYVKELSDCLMVFSTSGRPVSTRDPVHGTCFVNALVAAIHLKRHTTDVLSIINSVNYAVVHEENYILDAFKDKVAIRQCPIVVHSLTKRLYFR